MIRIASLALVLGVATVFVGEAHASFGPRLYVSHDPMSLGSWGTTSIRITNEPLAQAEALASVRVLVPRAYQVNLSALASPMGTASGVLMDNDDVVNGWVFPVSASSLDCTGRTVHDAALDVYFPAFGRPRIAVFLDAATGAEAASASYVAEFCFAQVADGSLPPLSALELNLHGIFSTPTVAGDYVWSAVATPWSGIEYIEPDFGSPPPNVARAVELRAGVPLPSGIKLSASVKNGVITVAGRAYEGGGAPPSALIHLTVGRHERTLTTGSGGAFRATLKLSPGQYTVRAEAIVDARDENLACTGGGNERLCGTETLPGWTSTRTLNVRVNR